MDQRAASVALFVLIFPTGWYRYVKKEIELSHMGKNNGNPDLVCEKYVIHTDQA